MTVTASADRDRPGRARRHRATRRRRRSPATPPASSSSRTAPTRGGSRSGSRSSHPLLGTERHIALTKPGTYTGTTPRRSAKVEPLPLSDRRRRVLPGARGRLPGDAHGKPVANFGVAVLSGHAVPHVIFAGDENHLVGLHRAAAVNSTRTSHELREAPPDRRRGAACPRRLRHRLRHPLDARGAGPFTFRFWVNDTTPPGCASLSTSEEDDRRLGDRCRRRRRSEVDRRRPSTATRSRHSYSATGSS